MRLDWWTLGLQAINLLVLIWILSRFFFKPIAKAISDRQAASSKLLDDAAQEREQAKAGSERIAKAEADTAKARSTILQDARDAAEQEELEIIASARAEVDKMLSDAKNDIALMRKKAEAAVDRRTIELAISITEKLLDRIPEKARISAFVEGLADSVKKLPEATLNEIRQADVPLTIRTARALSAEEEAVCREALAPILGREPHPDFVVDKGLIAGLALETPHALVANNFRTDLDHIAKALSDDQEP